MRDQRRFTEVFVDILLRVEFLLDPFGCIRLETLLWHPIVVKGVVG